MQLAKPIAAATEALLSTDPEPHKAREAIYAAYRKAAAMDPPGKLRSDYRAADAAFVRTAKDMVDRLDGWIAQRLAPGKPVPSILEARALAADKAAKAAPRGPREAARDAAAAETAAWAAAYAAWSAPDARIDLKYASDIPKLNADINNDVDRDYAIYRFWFEIAPRHLQLRDGTVSDADAPGVSKLRGALTPFPDLVRLLSSGKDRDDGSVFLIDPDALPAHRRQLRDRWEAAANAQAAAEIAYQADPDDAATLRRLSDRLDKEQAEGIKAALLAPAGPSADAQPL